MQSLCKHCRSVKSMTGTNLKSLLDEANEIEHIALPEINRLRRKHPFKINTLAYPEPWRKVFAKTKEEKMILY
jgi:hypothetical protein